MKFLIIAVLLCACGDVPNVVYECTCTRHCNDGNDITTKIGDVCAPADSEYVSASMKACSMDCVFSSTSVRCDALLSRTCQLP